MAWKEVVPPVFMVGSGGLSGAGDCCVYVIGLREGGTCLIDAGTSNATRVLANLAACPLQASSIEYLVLTHCHYDHAGAAHQFKTRFPAMHVIAHDADVPAIEGAPDTEVMTASSWYGEDFRPVKVDMRLRRDKEQFLLHGTELDIIHTPGHTPGSISVLLDTGESRVLFGQDIHGPFSPEFRSDIDAWAHSMFLLIGLDADVLCEGHFGIVKGREKVRRFIEDQLDRHGHGS